MKGSEDVLCEHCIIEGRNTIATKKVDFFGEELYLCIDCWRFAKEEGMFNKDTYGT